MGGTTPLMCVICQDALITPDTVVEVLAFGHTFHSECLTRLMAHRGLTRDTACPFGCHRTNHPLVIAVAADESAIPTPEQLAGAARAAQAARDAAVAAVVDGASDGGDGS